MTNSQKIETIKYTLNSLKAQNPKGMLLEAQAETQVIIAEELIKTNTNLLDVIVTLENVETAIRQRK
jgi:hypothetical protein